MFLLNEAWYGMVWYGMVWYGMVWYGMVWYGMVWYGMVWYGMVWYGMVCYGMVWYGMVWYGMVWYGTVRSGPVRYGTVRYGMVWYGMCGVADRVACSCMHVSGNLMVDAFSFLIRYGTLIRFPCTYLTNVKFKTHKTQTHSLKLLVQKSKRTQSSRN